LKDYLTHEIQMEGLVRNLPAFAKFLDSIGFSHGEMINYSNIARDCGVDAKTVKSYFQICIDTLLGYYLYPYTKQVRRDIILATPKFYLFDVGVANYLAKRSINILKDVAAGKSFEHFILLEILAYRGLQDKNFEIHYWRTKQGLEVDFILDSGRIAIEVKISSQINKSDLQGLVAFAEEHKPQGLYVVCLEPRARKTKIDMIDIDILPHEQFLRQLWSGDIL